MDKNRAIVVVETSEKKKIDLGAGTTIEITPVRTRSMDVQRELRAHSELVNKGFWYV